MRKYFIPSSFSKAFLQRNVAFFQLYRQMSGENSVDYGFLKNVFQDIEKEFNSSVDTVTKGKFVTMYVPFLLTLSFLI